MGLFRKAAIVGTGGMGRLFINQNSKKERTAIASHKTAKAQARTARAARSSARQLKKMRKG
jgi:hypothetical protein